MSAFFADVSSASLPVAIGLLLCAVAARAVLWAQVDHVRARQLADQYLAPLTTWCLVADATHALSLGAAGEADALSLALALGIGAAAVLLRLPEEADRPAEVELEEPPSAPAAATPPAVSLWAEPADDSARRTGLWSR